MCACPSSRFLNVWPNGAGGYAAFWSWVVPGPLRVIFKISSK